jgi:peptidoglycan/LPS O-acetylase OafA/YrhL
MAPGSTTGIVVAMTRLPRKPHPPLSTAILGGLAAGALGLVMQFVAEPAKFGVFPPGLYFVAGVMAIVWLGRRWRWSPLAAVALSMWITVGGNAVMVVGLVGAAVANLLATFRRPQDRAPRPALDAR